MSEMLLETVSHWSAGSRRGSIRGDVSGGIFGIDLDIDDMPTSLKAEKIAVEVFGETPFRRIGQAPRCMLFYRYEPGTKWRKQNVELPRGNHIELLCDGAPVTVIGTHHSTGGSFRWKGLDPACSRPDIAPVVTTEQLDEFWQRVRDELGAATRKQYTPTDGPVGVAKRVGKAVIPQAPVGPRAADLRETVVRDACFAIARNNFGLSFEELLAPTMAACADRIVMDGRWPNDLEKQVRQKLASAIDTIKLQGFKPTRIWQGEGDVVYAPRATVLEANNDEDMKLLCRRSENRRALKIAKTEKDSAAAFERALEYDKKKREKEADRVKAEVEGAIQKFLDDMWDALLDRNDDAIDALDKIRLLVAPTGAGKTTTFVRLFAAQVLRRGVLPGPVAMMTPSYANINEVRGRDDLGLQADVADSIEELESAADGIRHMVYRGKIKAGCEFPEFVSMLQGIGVGSSGLCVAETKSTEPGDKPETCQFYEDCPFIKQQRALKDQDLVLLPTAFLDTQIPAALKDAIKALVVDERCWTNLIHQVKIPLQEALRAGRAEPYYTDREKARAEETGEELLDPWLMLEDRNQLNLLLIDAARKGIDLAEAVMAHRTLGTEGRFISGEEMLKNAMKVDAKTSKARLKIHPNMVMPDLRRAVDDEGDRFLWQEKKLYILIKQRIAWIKEDRENAPLIANRTAKRKACGNRDWRISYHRNGETAETIAKAAREARYTQETLRLSWRSEPNFVALPTLMLDASADEDIVSKLWLGREVKKDEVKAKLHMRVLAVTDSTYSNRSMSPKCHESGLGAVLASKRQVGVKNILSAASVVFGMGRFVVGSTQAIKTEFNTAWRASDNLDWLHFGATKGLDFARHHKCAISIGRMEMPFSFIDGEVAALTYDDEQPEAPIDPLGSGLDKDGERIKAPMVERRIHMRDGSDVLTFVPEWQGYWARKVQRQFREEELRQFVGRIRPVYAEGTAPLVIMLSSIIPEDFIVDDMVTLEDMSVNKAYDAIRRAGGLLDIDITPAIAPDLDAYDDCDGMIAGIEEAGKLADSRLGQSFARYSYKLDGRKKETLALLGTADVASAIAAAHGRWSLDGTLDTNIDLRLVDIGFDGPRLEEPRTPDLKLIEDVGSLERRGRDEAELLHSVMHESVMQGTVKPGTRLIQAGPGDLAKEWLTVAEKAVLRMAGK